MFSDRTVINYLVISPDSDCEKKFENWLLFDGVIRRTKMCQFLGHPVEVRGS